MSGGDEENKPEVNEMGAPRWWHTHGDKMRVRCLGVLDNFLVIQGSAAELIISQPTSHGWLVKWNIRHGGVENSVSGNVIISSDELMAAFGLIGRTFEESEWLLKRFGGATAQQGKFIRYKEFLNIPGPGIGSDGDPNVSIEITIEIKAAIQKLLAL